MVVKYDKDKLRKFIDECDPNEIVCTVKPTPAYIAYWILDCAVERSIKENKANYDWARQIEPELDEIHKMSEGNNSFTISVNLDYWIGIHLANPNDKLRFALSDTFPEAYANWFWNAAHKIEDDLGNNPVTGWSEHAPSGYQQFEVSASHPLLYESLLWCELALASNGNEVNFIFGHVPVQSVCQEYASLLRELCNDVETK